METPGLSIFQGSDNIQINAATHRQEEDEEQEDRKRHNEEIKDMLDKGFDDLDEEDDVSSVNSSHFQDATRDINNLSNSLMNNCSVQPLVINDDKGPTTVSQYLNEFGYCTSEGNVNYAMSTPYPQQQQYQQHTSNNNNKKSSGLTDIQKDYDVNNQVVSTPVNSRKEFSTLKSIPESPYELPRPPNFVNNPTKFPSDLCAQINDGYTLLETVPYSSNYHTPSNHYDTHQHGKYSNNGYIGTYDNFLVQKNDNSKDIDEGSGGDGDGDDDDDDDNGGGDNNVSRDHYNHCYKTTPNGPRLPLTNDSEAAYKTAEYNSKEQLEILYSVRVREIERLTDELQQIKYDADKEKKKLSHELVIAHSEVERSNLSRNQVQMALTDAKAEIMQLQQQINTFREKIAVLEKANKNMIDELNISRESILDLQQKLSVMETVQSLHANDKTHERFLKQAQEKHSTEMKNMQTQIDILTDKLNQKESMYNSLEHKLSDVRRAHEALMVEKGESMNQLTKALENSQNQCRNIMASSNAQEIMQLQNRLKELSQEKEEMARTMNELKHQLELSKSDAIQYDSLLTGLDEESDSVQQLKSKNKAPDELLNKLHVELRRCYAGQAMKRKEITRLENTLAQKDEELQKALSRAETLHHEASRYSKRVSELEQELEQFITDHSIKATTQIKKLTENLTEVREQNTSLKHEKSKLQEKLEKTLACQEETIRKLHQESVAQQEKLKIDEYNKEYLEIHSKAVDRVRHEAQLEIVQLTVQLEQTQKELDRVKELYIEVCGTKEELMNHHKDEINKIKESYAHLETQKYEIDYMKLELEAQIKITKRLTQECESYKKKNMDLERDLTAERQKKAGYSKKIHEEIERAKDEALKELRNAHPEREISLLLPNHCTEHTDKIVQLETDCKRLEEKLSDALDGQYKMTELQSELDAAKLKMAQMEITQETFKKQYSNLMTEKRDLIAKLSKYHYELTSCSRKSRNNSNDDDDDDDISSRINLEPDTLKTMCGDLLKDKVEYRSKITNLEQQLTECKNKIIQLEVCNASQQNNDYLSTSRNDLEQELNRYKELVKQLTDQMNNSSTGNKDTRRDDAVGEERVRQLELELVEKEAQLQRLEDLEKIKEERDNLIQKLKNQAKQFEEYVKNQKQVSAELNLSPRTITDPSELQKIREMSIKKVREEMEQNVAIELRTIENQHREKQKSVEDTYKNVIAELNSRYAEKTKELESMREAMIAEKIKLQSSFKAQEQIVTQMIEAKIGEYKQELMARKLTIEKLQAELKEKEHDVEEVKSVMAQVMPEWADEVRTTKESELKLREEVNQLREIEKTWKAKEKEFKNCLDTYKRKYQSAKLSALNYKKYAEEKETFLMNECKRIEEGYKKAINQVQQGFDEIVSTQEKQMNEKMKELESQYEEKLQQVRRKLKYKDKH